MPFDIHAFLIEVSYKFGEGLLSTHLADLSVSLLKASGAYGADTWPEPYAGLRKWKTRCEVALSTGPWAFAPLTGKLVERVLHRN